MYNFHDFAITQILREIKFEDSRRTKSATITHLEDLNLDLSEFWHFLKAEIYESKTIQSPKKWQKRQILQF